MLEPLQKLQEAECFIASSRLIDTSVKGPFRNCTIRNTVHLTATKVNEFELSKRIYKEVFKLKSERSKPMLLS